MTTPAYVNRSPKPGSELSVERPGDGEAVVIFTRENHRALIQSDQAIPRRDWR